ncbi:MAG: NAD(P)H-dependent oxidoreductase [Actinomycetota bacterium]
MFPRPLRVAVIVGSTRPGRFGPVVADWVVRRARERGDVVIDFIDLDQVDLPSRHDPEHPAAHQLRECIDGADAFVVVTPEYNHGYPAALKQAIDLAYQEWFAKPVAFVSYGGIAGGLRAVEQLRQVFAELHAVTVRDVVSFHGPDGTFDPDGEPIDQARAEAALKVMLDRLSWWAEALRDARARRPYAA